VAGPWVSELLGTYPCEVDGGHYKCLGAGIELSVDNGLDVASVFLYADGVDGFSGYIGALPYGLYWGESWSEIEQEWGPPAEAHEPIEGGYDPTFFAVYGDDGAAWSTITLDFTPDTRELIRATFSS
jgi:hypothetical protein